MPRAARCPAAVRDRRHRGGRPGRRPGIVRLGRAERRRVVVLRGRTVRQLGERDPVHGLEGAAHVVPGGLDPADRVLPDHEQDARRTGDHEKADQHPAPAVQRRQAAPVLAPGTPVGRVAEPLPPRLLLPRCADTGGRRAGAQGKATPAAEPAARVVRVAAGRAGAVTGGDGDHRLRRARVPGRSRSGGRMHSCVSHRLRTWLDGRRRRGLGRLGRGLARGALFPFGGAFLVPAEVGTAVQAERGSGRVLLTARFADVDRRHLPLGAAAQRS